MKGSDARFLTTHTGSLPRPPELLALASREDGVNQAELDEALRNAVRESVRRQVAAGVDVVSDGEMSKPSYVTYVKDRLAGLEGPGSLPIPADLRDFPKYAERVFSDSAVRALSTPSCTGPVTYRDEEPVRRDIANLRAALIGQTDEQAFMTAASPGAISLFHENRHYPSHEAYIEALADAMRVEYRLIHEAGFLLQIDCPDLTMGRHTRFLDLDIVEYRKIVRLHIEALNHAVAGIPPGSMRLHLCWGNYAGPHHRDVPLEDILDIVLRARPSGLSFAAANPRHEHEWHIWERVHLPPGKVLIPGVVDPTTNFIEHPELVAERILRLSRLVGKKDVIAGTDSGFSTFAGYSPIEPSIVWAKLEALAEGANIASSRLAPIVRRTTTKTPAAQSH